MGNSSQAREGAAAALAISRNRPTMLLAGLALALAGDTAKANAIADEVARLFPLHTLINSVSCQPSGHRLKLFAAIPLKPSSCCGRHPRMNSVVARVLPNYIRGQAYLKARQGQEAAAEFQKILDHRGICLAAPECSLAHLGLGRARCSRETMPAPAPPIRISSRCGKMPTPTSPS